MRTLHEQAIRAYYDLYKIGCTSAIKVNFIAFGLHYLC